MEEKRFPGGVWPVMLTPFTEENQVDYAALKELVEWYIKNGVDGLFAVCQSSEMFKLTLKEQGNGSSESQRVCCRPCSGHRFRTHFRFCGRSDRRAEQSGCHWSGCSDSDYQPDGKRGRIR